MLSSRRPSASSTARAVRLGGADSAADPAAAASVAAAGSAVSGATPDHLLVLGGALEARRVRAVRPGVVLGDELQARVHLAGAGQAAGDLVDVELDDRIEALEVGLLVDREVDLVVLEELERLREGVVSAALDALVAELVLLDHLGDALGRARVDREHPLHVLVADVVPVDARQLLVELGAGGDRLVLDVGARVLDRFDRAVDPRLDVE